MHLPPTAAVLHFHTLTHLQTPEDSARSPGYYVSSNRFYQQQIRPRLTFLPKLAYSFQILCLIAIQHPTSPPNRRPELESQHLIFFGHLETFPFWVFFNYSCKHFKCFFVVSETGYFPQEVFYRGDESRYFNQTKFNHSVEIKQIFNLNNIKKHPVSAPCGFAEMCLASISRKPKICIPQHRSSN